MRNCWILGGFVRLGGFIVVRGRAGRFLEQFFYDLDIVVRQSVPRLFGCYRNVPALLWSRIVPWWIDLPLGSWFGRIGRRGVGIKVTIGAGKPWLLLGQLCWKRWLFRLALEIVLVNYVLNAAGFATGARPAMFPGGPAMGLWRGVSFRGRFHLSCRFSDILWWDGRAVISAIS